MRSRLAILVSLPLLAALQEVSAADAAAAATLRFLGNRSIPPIVMLQGDEPAGVAVDLARALAEKAGLAIQVEALDWPEAQRQVSAGEADALLQINRTPEREALFDFSQPLLESSFCIFRRSDRADIRDLQSLRGRKVGVEGSGFPQQYLRQFPDVQRVIVGSWEDAFRLLRDGTLDAVFVDRWVGEYELYLHQMDQVSVVMPALVTSHSRIAVRKGNTALLSAIDLGLAAIERDGTRRAILDRWQAKSVVYVSREAYQRQLLYGAGAGAALLLALLAWAVREVFAARRVSAATEGARRQLSELVEQRTAALAQANALSQRLEHTQREQRAILDSGVVGIAIVREGCVSWANEAFAALFGTDVGTLGGRAIQTCFPPDDALQSIERLLAECLETGQVLRSELLGARADGQRIRLDASLAPLDQESPGVLVAAVDVTERRQAEEVLRRAKDEAEETSRRLALSDQRLEAMLALGRRAQSLSVDELLQLGINEAARLPGSAIGYLHFVNEDQRTLRLVTWSTETLKVCSAVFDEHYPVDQAGIWADTVRQRRPVVHNDYPSAAGRRGVPEGHTPLQRHLGVPVVYEGRVVIAMGVGNKPSDYDESDLCELQLIGDELWRIYARRRAELELAAARREAEAANVAKSAFLANMSHEIRTPMNAILGMTYLVRKAGVSPRQAEQLDKVAAAGRHLLAILNDVLDLSKIEAGKFQLSEQAFEIAELARSLESVIGEGARAKGLALTLDLSALPPVMRGDRMRVQQALLNYLGNAVKFTPAGEIVLRARIVDDGVADCLVRFEVRDTGIGIPADALRRLFVPFQQADDSRTREFGGTGLGLVITRHLAEMMGGSTGAESTPGQGSLFWLTARLGKVADASAAGPAAESNALQLLRQRHAGARVLIAEDNPVSSELACDLLRHAGLEPDVAADGRDVLTLAAAFEYRLVLMDLQMPYLDGLTATRALRALPGHYATVPILALTANAYEEDQRACREAGMDGFLAKPLDPDTVYAYLLRWLERR